MTLVGKSRTESRIYDGMPPRQQLPRVFETQLQQIVVRGDALGRAKKTNQVVAGALQKTGDLVEGELTIYIGVKKFDDRFDPFPIGGASHRFPVLPGRKQATEAGQEVDFRLQSGGGVQQGIVKFDKQPPERAIRDDTGRQRRRSRATCYLCRNIGQKTFRKVKTSQMAAVRPARSVCVDYPRFDDGEGTGLQYCCRTVQREILAACGIQPEYIPVVEMRRKLSIICAGKDFQAGL